MLNMVCVNSSYSVLHRTQHRKGVMCVVSLNFRLFYFVQCHVWRSSYQCRNATINHMCEYTYWFQHIFLQYRRYWMSKVNPSPRLSCIMWSCIKILKITFWHIIWQSRQRSNENSAPWVVEIFSEGRNFFVDLTANERQGKFFVYSSALIMKHHHILIFDDIILS